VAKENKSISQKAEDVLEVLRLTGMSRSRRGKTWSDVLRLRWDLSFSLLGKAKRSLGVRNSSSWKGARAPSANWAQDI
jgi:hypothetical protein